MPAPEVAKVRRYLFSMASRVEPDKQGRVVIPDRFMTDSKNRDPISQGIVGREVTLVGANDRVELWNRADYVAHMRELMADRLSFQATMQQMFGNAPASGQGNGTGSGV